MDFSLDELRSLLEEMGFKNVPDNHLELFAKDLSKLMRHEKHVQKRHQKITSAPVKDLPRESVEASTSSHHSSASTSNGFLPPRHQSASVRQRDSAQAISTKESEITKQENPPKPPTRRAKSSEATRMKLKTDPVRLYHWYKTNWDHHGLK